MTSFLCLLQPVNTTTTTMKLGLQTPPPLTPRISISPFPKHKPIHFHSNPSTFTKLSQSSALSSSSSHSILDSNIQKLNTEFNNVSVGTAMPLPLFSLPKWTPTNQASFLLTFIVCTTSVSFTSLVIAAVPTISAMGRAAISLSKLADTAREELPSTMAAGRLSVMEISDLTLELSDLSHEIADGFTKSAQAVQAAETGIKQIGSIAREQTMSMIHERASLPPISIQPIVAGAAKKTSRAVSQVTKSIVNMISGEEEHTEEDGNISIG